MDSHGTSWLVLLAVITNLYLTESTEYATYQKGTSYWRAIKGSVSNREILCVKSCITDVANLIFFSAGAFSLNGQLLVNVVIL